jgi:16S rRNA (cytidine1402-2'-O)-methyltransferase
VTEAGPEQGARPPLKARLEPGLWLVATPIGNLGDFSPRAQATLAGADLILAEDTRMTRKLMGAFGLSGRVERCDEAATAQGLRKALETLEAGGAVAFVSDAGTPGVSDPGERLAAGVIAQGHAVRATPGASALLAGLVVSGLPTRQFLFAGFPPPKQGARRTFLAGLAEQTVTLIFFETGPRLAASLADMAEAFGDRPACVARELTKLHEEARRDCLPALAAHYADAGPPKGEIVVIVGGAPEAAPLPDAALDALLREAMAAGAGVRDAADQVAARTGRMRRTLYARALALSAGDEDA